MRRHATAAPGATTTRRSPAWLLTLVLGCALGGCGGAEPPPEQPSERASESLTSASPAPPSDPPTDPAAGEPLDEPGLVALESASQAGGSTDAPPVVIERLADVDELTTGLDARLADAVRARARTLLPRVADDLELVGAVVWVGCEVPSDVTVEGEGADVTLTAAVPDKGSVQCLVPVTTVALVVAPRA